MSLGYWLPTYEKEEIIPLFTLRARLQGSRLLPESS